MEGRRIGYARVSTKEQNLDLQLNAMKDCQRIFKEKRSGADDDRPELAKAIKYLNEGDTLVIWKLDRLGRNTRHILNTIHDLKERGVAVQSIQEGIDANTVMGRAMITMLSVFAEIEREAGRERRDAGIAAYKANGGKFGKPPRLNAEHVRQAREWIAAGTHTANSVAAMFGVSRWTLGRAFKRFPA